MNPKFVPSKTINRVMFMKKVIASKHVRILFTKILMLSLDSNIDFLIFSILVIAVRSNF